MGSPHFTEQFKVNWCLCDVTSNMPVLMDNVQSGAQIVDTFENNFDAFACVTKYTVELPY